MSFKLETKKKSSRRNLHSQHIERMNWNEKIPMYESEIEEKRIFNWRMIENPSNRTFHRSEHAFLSFLRMCGEASRSWHCAPSEEMTQFLCCWLAISLTSCAELGNVRNDVWDAFELDRLLASKLKVVLESHRNQDGNQFYMLQRFNCTNECLTTHSTAEWTSMELRTISLVCSACIVNYIHHINSLQCRWNVEIKKKLNRLKQSFSLSCLQVHMHMMKFNIEKTSERLQFNKNDLHIYPRLHTPLSIREFNNCHSTAAVQCKSNFDQDQVDFFHTWIIVVCKQFAKNKKSSKICVEVNIRFYDPLVDHNRAQSYEECEEFQVFLRCCRRLLVDNGHDESCSSLRWHCNKLDSN